MQLETQITQIRYVGIFVAVFGVLTALAAYPPLNGFIVWIADMLVWPIDGAQTGLDSTARLMFAIGGGIFAGFGMIWILCGDAFRAAPHQMRRLLMAGAMTWFVVDSTGSVLADAASNVIPNIGFLALLLWPLRKAPEAVAA